MAGVHERSEREDFGLGNDMWCFRRKVRAGLTIGGSETGWVVVCMSFPDIGVMLGEGEGMVVAGVVVDSCGTTDGTTTLVAGNPRRMRSGVDFGGRSVPRQLVVLAVTLTIEPRSEWG
jgi:hypothetical protein